MTRTKKKDLSASKVLGEFENMPVIESTIAITNAGDGLSKAMQVNPVAIHLGEDVFVVLATKASQVKMKPHKDNANMLVRTVVLSAGVATIVDEELVRDVLDAQQDKLDEAAGISRLPYDEAEPSE